MNTLQQRQGQPEMLFAAGPVQNTEPEKSCHQKQPQNKLDGKAQMALQQAQKTGARLKMAKLFHRYRAQLRSNKYGVTVTSDPVSNEETICLTVNQNKKIVPLTVKNSGISVIYLTLLVSDLIENIYSVRDSEGNLIKSVKKHVLGPGHEFKISIHFSSDHAGLYELLLVFMFETCQKPSDKFEIMRLLEVTHWTSSSEELFPAHRNSCNHQSEDFTTTESVRTLFVKPAVPLKGYEMPDKIKDISETNLDLQEPLKWANYSKRLHLLLHLEELQLKKEIETFKHNSVPIFRHKRCTDLFILKIQEISTRAGLLSRLEGTRAQVTLVDRSVAGKITFKGFVQHVDAETVYVEFDEQFQAIFKEGMRFRVTFAIDRGPLRVQHRAVAHVYHNRLQEVLFPTGQQSAHASHLPSLLELDSNPEQLKAIQHIVAATAKPAPYLIFGPPGTGKTMTLVGAIKQILQTQNSCNILACAPSNNATDHLCEKILEDSMHMGQHVVYRLYALSFPVNKIPKNRKFCCNLECDKNTLKIPTIEELRKHKIIFTTLQTSGRLVAQGIPSDHFTYIFVDEAGQATETECLIPLSGLLTPHKCQVVLAGDPKQLGPTIASRLAEANGLGVSLLERLMMNINLYKSHETYGFNHRFITKLLRNYRSHPAILKIPNELFYEGELQAFAAKEICKSYCKWERLPQKEFPLIFHGVAGTTERDANSPSFYNMAEVEVLKEYLKALIDHLRQNAVTTIQPQEVGIVTPYRKQVEKIQYALRLDRDLKRENLENVLVGSVEQFQGKEFKVILLSTVRSFPKLTATRQRFSLGFVDNEKRFNVALTRARALLIVVGDPRVLKTDLNWNKFIHYCSTQGGYRGITVSDAEEEEDTLESDPATAGPPLKEPTDVTLLMLAPVFNKNLRINN